MTDEEKESAIKLIQSVACEMGISLSDKQIMDIAIKCAGDKSCIRSEVQSKKIQPSIEIKKEPTPPWSPPSPRM